MPSTGAVNGQVTTDAGTSAGPSALHSPSTSRTYASTIGTLKAWINSGGEADLARLFAGGEARTQDLIAACQSSDDNVAVAAYQVLDFLGARGLGTCATSLERRHGGLLDPSGTSLSDADIDKVDRWLAEKRSEGRFSCEDSGGSDIDDALVYSLILNGSPLSVSVLARMKSYGERCLGGDKAFLVADADALIDSAKKIGHNLRIGPDIGESIRAFAFFLPFDSRKNSEVDAIARNDRRILLSVRYSAGFMGGGIYYVVLRKDGPLWQYAVIRRWSSF